ncbi:MAG TPA: C40 family peptidase [Longimicrobiaceae bacterium]|nr:C40 family peptidase [Longimicrobiaceae bacterium]
MKRFRHPALRALVLSGLVLGPSAAVAQQGLAGARREAATQQQRDSIVAMARRQIGRRYIFGGTSPEGFDCSGFVRYLMRAFDVQLPRTAAQMARTGHEVPRDVSQLLPGDILTFGTGRVSHVGIYVGNGRYIHASSLAGRVIESNLDRPASPLIKAWAGVRRFLSSGDSTTSVAQR